MNILFVDDDEFIRKALRRLLTGARDDWNVDFAESGAQAIEKLQSQEFDAIVSDMRMPGMDGAELLAIVAAKYPQTTRIILSGQAEQDAFEQAVENAQHYLSKPCSLADLEKALLQQQDCQEPGSLTR